MTPNDSQVFLDDQLRAERQKKSTWSLYPRDNDWRWVRDEVRMEVDHVTWWETRVRPVLALIYNRPWLGRAAPAAAQGRDYKVAQHASSQVQDQASSLPGQDPGPLSERLHCANDPGSTPSSNQIDSHRAQGPATPVYEPQGQALPQRDPKQRPGPYLALHGKE